LKGQIAGVIFTPYHHVTWGDQIMPPAGWHEEVRRLCDSEGALFIMDDIRANFCLSINGSHTVTGVRQDMVTMDKSLASGYPIGVLREVKD